MKNVWCSARQRLMLRQATGKLRLLIAVALAGALAAACSSAGSSASSKKAGSATLINFPTATFPEVVYAPDFVAQQLGYFKQHHLNVTFTYPTSGAAAAQLLLAGTIHGWSGPTDFAIIAASKGEAIKMAGMPYPYSTDYLIVSNKEKWPSTTATFQQKMDALKGKTIGVSGIGAGTDHTLLAALAAAGVPANDVHIIGVGTTESGLGQLEAGRIDGYVDFARSGVQIISSAGAGHEYINFAASSTPTSVRDTASNAFLVSAAYYKQHPAAVHDYVAAEAEAIKYIQANPEAASKIVAKYAFKGKHVDWALQDMNELRTKMWPSNLPNLEVSRTVFSDWIKVLAKEGNSVGNVTYNSTVLPFAQEKP